MNLGVGPLIRRHELMLITLWLLLGLLLGSAFIALARTTVRSERRFLAAGLVIAALIYVGFATASSAYVPWLALETLGVGFYGALAWLGLRYSPWWLALGWATHPAWDVGLHLVGDGSAFTPAWYSVACVSFDLLVAVYLAGQVWKRPNAALNPDAQKPRAG